MLKNHKCNFPAPLAKGNWKCCICQQVFRTRREMQSHKKCEHKQFVNQPWNKGQTKETNKSLEKASETYKLNIKLGKIKPAMLGKHISDSAKTKISEAISKRNELIQGGNGGRKDVKWFKVSNLNNVEFIVRGTWELNVAKRLNTLGIIWIKNQRISYIKDGIKKWYNPDFYLPLTNEYIEVKGWFNEKDRLKMNLVHKQYPQYKIYFIDKIWYNEFISNGSLKFEMLYNGQ